MTYKSDTHCADERFGGPGPMFRIAFPAFSIRRRKIKDEPPAPALRDVFASHFDRDLRPSDSKDASLSENDRDQVEHTQRLRDALFSR